MYFMKRRGYLIYILAVTLAAVFTGCGRPVTPKKIFEPRRTLTIAMSLGEEEWQVFREVIFPEFEKGHKVRIKAYQIESGQLAVKLEALRQSGKPEIDIFAQDNMELSAIINKDLAADLSGYEEDIPPEVLPNIVESCKFNGRLMFMPFRPNVQIVYYNHTAFTSYQIGVPRRWEVLLKVAQKFKESEGRSRFLLKAFGGNPTATQIYEFILQADGVPYEFNDIGCIQAFRFLQELWEYTSEESLRAKWDTANEIFARQEVYIAQNWPFGIKVLDDYELPFDYRTYSGWEGPAGERHVIGGDVFGIPVNAENREDALRFIKYMQSQQAQSVLVSRLGWPSIRQDAYNYEGVDLRMRAHYESIKQAMEHGEFRENVTWWPAYTKYVTEAFKEIVVNGRPVEETLNLYKQKLEEEKALYR